MKRYWWESRRLVIISCAYRILTYLTPLTSLRLPTTKSNMHHCHGLFLASSLYFPFGNPFRCYQAESSCICIMQKRYILSQPLKTPIGTLPFRVRSRLININHSLVAIENWASTPPFLRKRWLQYAWVFLVLYFSNKPTRQWLSSEIVLWMSTESME